jgi:hypothetical protein
MKFYWISLVFLIIFSINPAYSLDGEDIMASEDPVAKEVVAEDSVLKEPAVEDQTLSEHESKKPDDDKDDPLTGAEVTIHKSDERTVEEYRINGKLRYVKITPKQGYPYYLIDTDGNGSLDQRSSGLQGVSTINTWKIFQW